MAIVIAGGGAAHESAQSTDTNGFTTAGISYSVRQTRHW